MKKGKEFKLYCSKITIKNLKIFDFDKNFEFKNK